MTSTGQKKKKEFCMYGNWVTGHQIQYTPCMNSTQEIENLQLLNSMVHINTQQSVSQKA